MFSQKKQPKIGLVLSGGGAKGFAHIGVLKEIERAGIKLDYIGGTSMGAIIGGLYAAGYSADQLEKIIIETDFYTLLQDKLPRSSKPFFEKELGEKHAISFPFINGKISFPRGVSKGQNILNFFTELLHPVEKITNFKKLPIPFFCIATDVETGEEVVLEKGFLPLALRASGSFPTLLNPVELDGKLLIDGGVANNFPVDIMKKKGIDIIIGVDVEGRLYKKEKLTSVLSILNQIVSYRMYAKSNLEKKITDIYLHPKITDYSVVDFAKSKEILKKGEEVTLKFRAVFEELAKKQRVKKKKKGIEIRSKKIKVDKIIISGIKNYTRAYVLGKLKIQQGDSLFVREISQKIDFLSATKNYERVDYHLKKTAKGTSLYFNLIESKDRTNLRLGVHYDFLYKSGLLVNYYHKSLLGKNDVLSMNAVLGDNLRYNLNYFVDNGFYTSYGFRSRYNHFNTAAPFSGINTVSRINLNYTDFTNQVFIQTAFSRKFTVGLGAEYKKINVTTETLASSNNNITTFDNSSYFNLFSYLKLDTYNHKYFATKGFYANIGAKWYVTSTDFSNNFSKFLQLKGKLGVATSIGKDFIFRYTSEAGFTLDTPTSTVFDFYLGGINQNYINTFVPFYGYEFGELSNKAFLKLEFLFRYQFVENHYATFIANYARLDKNVFRDINIFKGIKSGYAIGYSINTLIGPVELKYSWSPDTNKNYWTFNLGFWF